MKTAPLTLDAVHAAARAFWSVVYPATCEQCGAAIPESEYLCIACAAGAQHIHPPRCEVCSEPFQGSMPGGFTCANCAGRGFHFSCAVAPFRSTGIVRELIHRFKYGGAHRLRHQLARWLIEGLEDDRIRSRPPDALVPVPLFAARERLREFNQAQALADLAGAHTGIPVWNCLRRVRNTTTQVSQGRARRMENLRNAFALRQTTPLRGRHVVLVDDVLTTGSTLDECARVLLAGGAASVRGLTVARG